VYKGYVDYRFNTDNAWMETTAYNFHDNHGFFDKLKEHDGLLLIILKFKKIYIHFNSLFFNFRM
jgi:hypothetical protein